MPYQQSNKFLNEKPLYDAERSPEQFEQNKQQKLKNLIQNQVQKGNIQATIEFIDKFCSVTPMMNIGDEKGQILKAALAESQPKIILELGGYCGYSALFMAHHSKAVIHTIEPDNKFIEIAKAIHRHCGISERINIHQGVLNNFKEFIINNGKFDLIFIDHEKQLYLQDLLELQKLGAIGQGTIVVGDNMIYPGSPDYLQYFKNSKDYNSILYYSHLEYSSMADAVLISKRLN